MKLGRNDPCICGSGKKYKKCCGQIEPGSSVQSRQQSTNAAAQNSPAKGAALAQDEFNQLVALYNIGRYAELESRACLLVKQYPDFGFAWKILGVTLKVLGKDSLHALQKTTELLPDDVEAHNNLGIALLELGLLDKAEASYRRALQIKPDYVDTHYNLGNTFRNLGRLDEAEASYRSALQIKLDYAEVHCNLGSVMLEQGRTAEAEDSYRLALQIKPNYTAAHYNLGNILQDLGRLREAEASYRRALEINPDFAEAHSNLGNCLKYLGRLDEAETSCRWALQIKPDYAEGHYNLGLLLMKLGRLDEAAASYRRALEVKPDFVEAYYNLGVAFRDMGRLDEAEISFRRTLQVKPDFAEAHYNLGIILRGMGRLDEAEVSCRQALQLKPDYAEVHNNLGSAFLDIGRLNEAEACCRRALEIKPDLVEAHYNLGRIFVSLNRSDEAEVSYRRALEIKPDWAEALNNLAILLMNLGRLDEAEVSFRRVLQVKPDYAGAHSNLLFCLTHNATVGTDTLFSEHCRFGEQFESPFLANYPSHTNSRNPERALRIGFVSGDLHNHPVACFIEPILKYLSGYPQLSLHAYCNNVIEDAITHHIREYFTQWHFIVDLSDAVLAEKIRDDGIDILIDISGHTAYNRLLTFARKPVPVQASWIGYPGTTGLRAMDYYLADRFLLPHGQFEGQFTEKIVRLPANAPFLPFEGAPPVNILPALSNGFVTFGSFNRLSKIRRPVIALWAQLLRALPDSRMVLGGMPEAGQHNALIGWFAQEGIARERLNFYPRSDMSSYLSLHRQVDICLDTFPYNGGTTTLYALLMGVPTLTLAGDTLPGRVGAGILGHAGLEAFVAHDAADFVQMGLSWAGNLAALSDIRAGLRERFEQSAMCQPAVIAAGLERALRIMWRRWCAGLPPESFDVSLQEAKNMMQEAVK